LLNTAIDADDGNALLRERARKALKSFQAKIESLVESGVERREIRHGVNAREVANTIIGALEGALMIARLERNDAPLRHAQAHLESFLDSLLRQPKHGKA
jgi:TetR/AcrR family transcriptional repressor of nem operon